MDWQGANLAFWMITVVVIASAGTAAFARNIVQAAYSLFFTLIGMAGYYVLLGSGFLAITQVIIYVGGILVLIMFGILLTNRPLERVLTGNWIRNLAAGVVGVLLMGVMLRVILGGGWVVSGPLTVPLVSVRQLGEMLFGAYLLPFELAGMTLLLCLIGAAYLVRRQER